jgi:hypothetical protein
VTFSGGELAGSYTREAVIAATSVLLDLEYYAASLTPPPPVGDGTGTGGGGGNSGGGGGGGCFITAAQPDGSPFAPLALIGVVLLWLPALRRTALS